MEDSSNFASLGPLLLARKGAAKPAMVPFNGSSDQGDTVRSGSAGDIVEPFHHENEPENAPESGAPQTDMITAEGAVQTSAPLTLTPPDAPSSDSNWAGSAWDSTPSHETPAQETSAQDSTAEEISAEIKAPEVHRQREELAHRLVADDLAREQMDDAAQQAPQAAEVREPLIQQKPAPQPMMPTTHGLKPSGSKTQAQSKLSPRRAAFTLRLDADRHLRLRLASTVSGQSAQQLVTQALDRFLEDMPEIELLAAQVSGDKT